MNAVREIWREYELASRSDSDRCASPRVPWLVAGRWIRKLSVKEKELVVAGWSRKQVLRDGVHRKNASLRVRDDARGRGGDHRRNARRHDGDGDAHGRGGDDDHRRSGRHRGHCALERGHGRGWSAYRLSCSISKEGDGEL